MRLLIYGAGCIGRGFIAPIFASNGHEITFIDIDAELVRSINARGSYQFSIVERREEICEITGVRAVDGGDVDAVLREIVSCELMATSLGAIALEKVAPIIAEGFLLRKRPLDILICENLKNASHKLREWIGGALPADADLSKLGLAETAIGRISMIRDGKLCVEPYEFLPADASAFVGTVPKLTQLVAHAPFSYYEDRKLYIHNLGHAVCAYYGILAGCDMIWQALENPLILGIVKGAMLESAAALSEEYGVSFGALYSHIEDLLVRFANRPLGDDCARVGREPLRKLAWDDRLVAPCQMALKHDIYPENILTGIAAALRFATDSRDEAARILAEICRVAEPAPFLRLYDAIRDGGVEKAAALSRETRLARKRTII